MRLTHYPDRFGSYQADLNRSLAGLIQILAALFVELLRRQERHGRQILQWGGE